MYCRLLIQIWRLIHPFLNQELESFMGVYSILVQRIMEPGIRTIYVAESQYVLNGGATGGDSVSDYACNNARNELTNFRV